MSDVKENAVLLVDDDEDISYLIEQSLDNLKKSDKASVFL